MKSSEENQTLEDPEIKGAYTEMAKAKTESTSDFDGGLEKAASEVNVNFNQNILDGIKAEPNSNNSNMLSSDLYDPDITEICLGDFISDKGKSSESDGSLIEINGSNESPFNDAKKDNDDDKIDKTTINDFENMIKKDGNADAIHIDSRKRPLSPSRSNTEESECKRVKYDDGNTLANSSSQPQTTQSDIVDAVTDNNLPIAVVAPLGFSEDLFIDAPSLKEKDNANAKQDIASLLDTFGDGNEKSLTLFDADFDKIKSDIISSNSFKTPDGNCWTFDMPPSSFDNLFEKEPSKSDKKQNISQSEEKLANIEETQKKSFQRKPSVEHDIRDFEKVLNNIMQKGSQSINPCTRSQESISTHLQYTLPRNSVTTSRCHQSPNQPCQHVANSDLLRELLDQKTETTSAQAKRRQEIDLSFLQPDVVAGKGLSVSSDKILQTRTIDPRLTSKPYVESSRNAVPYASVSSASIAQSTSNSSNMKPTVSCNTVVSSMSALDPISLAEQRKASITLHHKVPPYDVPNNSLTSLPSNDESATSNIIKEAFDFATEFTDHGYESVRSSNPSPRYDNRPHGMNGTNNSQIDTIFTAEQRIRPQNDFFPNGLRNKTAPMLNRQMVGNRPPLDINSTGLQMKFEESNVRSYDQTSNIRPNSVEQDSSITSPNLEFPAVGPHSRSQSFPNSENKAAANGAAYLSDGDIRGMQQSNSISVQVDPHFRMDPIQSQSLLGEQFHNVSNRRFMPDSSMDNSDRSQLANMMQRNSQQKYTVTPSMGFQPNSINPSAYTMPHQGQAMRRPMPGPDLLQIAPDDPMQSRPPDLGSSSRVGMGMVRPDNNLQIGMQERIRAMNVQHWYRRRIQAQMNRFPQQQHQPPQQQMMPRPGMGPTGFPGHDTVRPQAPLAVVNNPPRQGTNIGMQRYGYPMGNVQGQNQYQNKVDQEHGQMSYRQYMDQRSQRITDMQMQNQMRTPRSFNTGNPADNTRNGMEQTVFPDSFPEFDVKQQQHIQQGSEMFPFNI